MRSLVVWLAVLACQFGVVFVCAGEEVIDVQTHRQLFIDDHGVAEMQNLQRVVNQPLKHAGNPLIEADTPWEGWRVQLYGSVMRNAETGLCKIWYFIFSGTEFDPPVLADGKKRGPLTGFLGYATSTDGVKWTKPALGLVDFAGSRQNNLTSFEGKEPVAGEGFGIIDDAKGPDESRRYKAIFSHGWNNPAGGVFYSFSADGLTWTLPEDRRAKSGYSDTGQCLLWDPRLNKYVAYGRFGGVGRRVARMESDDFVHWTDPVLVFEADKDDGPNAQIYGISVNYYEGVYIGMIWMYHAGTDERIDVQLIHSRDGIAWQRTGDRAVFIPNGPEGAWDRGLILGTANGLVQLDDHIYIYYSAHIANHGKGRGRSREASLMYRCGGIGLAMLRRDGWVSLDAGVKPGHVITKPFVVPPPADGKSAPELLVNANAYMGEVSVSILDADGNPIEGFTKSNPIQHDALRTQITWPNADPATLVGRTVQLRFDVELAKIYAYWFE